jgi:diacylglycerol kinase (ATP)
MNAKVPFKSPAPSTFVESLTYAWNGILHTVVHQRNMRMHVIAAMLVSMVGAGIPLGLAEKVTLIFCVMMVFFAETLNSALEQLVDLATEMQHERARIAKDAAAAGVLVLAIGTVVVFAAILVHNATAVMGHLAEVQAQVIAGVPITFLLGLLMHERRRPAVLDVAAFLGGCGLTAWTVTWTFSYVFSAMSFGLLVVAAGAARMRHKQGSFEK